MSGCANEWVEFAIIPELRLTEGETVLVDHDDLVVRNAAGEVLAFLVPKKGATGLPGLP